MNDFERKVKSLDDKVVLHPGGWEIPPWLKWAIILDRLEEEEKIATDAEVCAYLMTASFAAPIGEYTEIQLYVATRTMRRYGMAVPEDIAVEELTEYQMGLLRDLKRQIFSKRERERRK